MKARNGRYDKEWRRAFAIRRKKRVLHVFVCEVNNALRNSFSNKRSHDMNLGRYLQSNELVHIQPYHHGLVLTRSYSLRSYSIFSPERDLSCSSVSLRCIGLRFIVKRDE